MNWFPQLSAGSVAQLPVARSRSWRTISNRLENGELVALPDNYSNSISWQLAYQDLSDTETSLIYGLFTLCRGSEAPFGFVDPLANLLAWSEDLSRSDWLAGPLQTGSGISDPLDGTGGWSVFNQAAGPLTLQQTIALPGSYTACFSVWLKAASKATAVLVRDSLTSSVTVGTAWTRLSITGPGTTNATTSTFGITLAAGQQLSVFGPQVEIQPNPSAYKKTVAARGIYPNTWFASDQLTLTSIAQGRTNSGIQLISRF